MRCNVSFRTRVAFQAASVFVLLAAAGGASADPAANGTAAPSIGADTSAIPPECAQAPEQNARNAQQQARQQKVNGNHTANAPNNLNSLSCLDNLLGINMTITYPSLPAAAQQAIQAAVTQVEGQICTAASTEWNALTSQALTAVESAIPLQKTSAGGILGTINAAVGTAAKTGITAAAGNASGITNNLQSLGTAGSAISQQATNLGNQISNQANKAGSAISNSVSQAGQAASSIFGPGPNN